MRNLKYPAALAARYFLLRQLVGGVKMEFVLSFDEPGQFIVFGRILRESIAAVSGYFRISKEHLWRERDLPLSVGFSQDPHKGLVIHFILDALMDRIEAQCFQTSPDQPISVLLIEVSRRDESRSVTKRAVIQAGELKMLGVG